MTNKVPTAACVALVLVLLSLASTAHGFPFRFLTVNGDDINDIQIEPGESVTIEINSADYGVYTYHIGFLDSPIAAEFSLVEIRSEAGNAAFAESIEEASFSGYGVLAVDFSDPCLPVPGVHFVFEYTPFAEGETDLLLLELEGLWPIDSVHIIVSEEPLDNEPPTPNPMNWAKRPTAISSTEITMTATTAHDPSGVQYYFECLLGGGHDSGWQSSPTYTDTSLQPGTLYWYWVKARDMSGNHNETAWSPTGVANTHSELNLDEGLVAYWPLDDAVGLIAIDRSGNGNHGALSTSPIPVWQPYGGQVNGAFLFDGRGGYVVDEDAEAYLNGLDALTVCAWVKSNVIGTDSGFIILSEPDTTDDRDIRYDVAGAEGAGVDLIKCGITSTGGRQQLESSSNVQTTEWQHLAMTWSSGDLVKLYINGVQDTPAWVEPPTEGTLTGCTKLIVGKGGKDMGSVSWDGLVDDVRVYGVALNAWEIMFLVLRDTPPQKILLTHWKFDELTGTTAGDSAPGSLNPGALRGSGPTWETGKLSGALMFHGGGEHVNCGNDPVFDLTEEITVGAWVNIHTVPADWAGIVTKGDSAWRLSTFLNQPMFHFAVTSPAAGVNWVNGVTEVPLGEWHHVCGTYDGDGIHLYVDGEEDLGSPVGYSGSIETSIHDVWIGGNSDMPGREFHGLIDEVAIWNRALTPEELGWLYNDNTGNPIVPAIRVYVVDDDAQGDPGPGIPDVGDPDEDGSPQHPFDSVQEAIDAALDGDTVVVLDGTYVGIGNRDIDFGGKAITVRSQDGPDRCVIDCEQNGIGFKFISGETDTSVLDGFTVTKGLPRDIGQGGGGVYCYFSSPTISNCIITNNKAWRGGGVFCHNSSPTITNCTISKNEPDGIGLDLASNAWILGTVHIISDDLTGEGALHIERDSTLRLDDSHISCNVVGLGAVRVPVGKRLIVGNTAIIDLGDPNDPNTSGTIQCDGWLRVTDDAQLLNAEIGVVRATFEGNAVISNNVITVQAKGRYTRIEAKDAAAIVGNDIHANGDRYMELVALAFAGVIQDNRISITITEGQGGTPAGLFELRGRDLFCPTPPCGFGAFSLPAVPASSQVTWTIERMELQAGTVARLTNRFDFQPPYDAGGAGEVLYVKQLILGPYAVLDTAFNRLYYESLQMHPTAQIVNLPLLAFSLNNLDFDDEPEYLSRVIHNNFIDPDQPALDRIHVERVVGLEPDPAGMMRMRNLPDLDPTSPNYRRMISARAKGSFAKAGEDEIVIRFKYLFESAEPGTELVVYLSDVPELLARNDPQWAEHYLEVARIAAPPAYRPGSVDSRRFAVFQQRVPTEHLNFTQGTWIELELVEPESIVGVLPAGYRATQSTGGGAKVLINDVNPAIWCYGICLDLNSSNFVDEVDFLMVIGELGHLAIGDLDCVDGVLSNDGYVDPRDVVSWDWAMNAADRLLNFCGVPLVSGSVSMGSIAAMSSAAQLPLGSLPSNFSDLLITGKRGTDDAAGKLKDRLYVFDSNGLCTGWSAPASDRCNIGVVQDVEGKLYQLNSETGVLRLDDPNVVIIPPGATELADINEPRYDRPATVYVGIQGDDPDKFGRPVLDASFDANYVYVVPVVVNPDGNDPYLAAAKLELLDGEEPPYQVVQLYDDPNTFNPDDGDNPNLNGLCDIELDDEGNLYVLNVHSRNESDILWRHEPNGAIERLDLGVEDSNNYVLGPTAMHISNTADMLYLASSQYNPNDVNSTVIYGFSTDGPLTLERSVTITSMHHVSSITEDPNTSTLWVAGFNMEDIPLFPNPDEPPFYEPYLAKVSPDSNDVQLISLSDPDSHDLALPMSIVWTETIKCGGADIDGSGSVDFADLAALAKHWLKSGCGHPDWCGGADIDKNSQVDMADVAIVTQHWLESGCLD